ncbi:MAG: hypothetical protein R3301_18120, partial [Saprospiraceae bacterium]|nr:hypothetical protein [Saprospiraceae bacterium]
MASPLNYEDLFDERIARDQDVIPGLMMREPALKCQGKVFAFYYQDKDAICVKLGKGYPLEVHGIKDYALLSPFKHKPPMAAWFVVDRAYQDQWGDL